MSKLLRWSLSRYRPEEVRIIREDRLEMHLKRTPERRVIKPAQKPTKVAKRARKALQTPLRLQNSGLAAHLKSGHAQNLATEESVPGETLSGLQRLKGSTTAFPSSCEL